jgi:tetratricopeptide (TPR) repeat protein
MNTRRQQELARLRDIAMAQPEIVQGHVRYIEEALKEEMGSDVAEYLLELVNRTRDWPQLHCDVVVALERQGDGRLIHESLCAVSADHPEGPLVGYLLGVHLSIRRDYERAEIGLRAALKYMPDLAAAHFFLGVVYQQQRSLPNAVAECHTALALSPQMAEPYFALGVMEAQNSNMDAANANMLAFLERAGMYLGSYMTAALTHLKMMGQ